jgi:hypothetical protein
MLRNGLVTGDQLARALNEQLESGREIAEIAVEHGWVSEHDLSAFTPTPAPVTPVAPVPPPLAVVPEPVAPMLAAQPATRTDLYVRLSNGDRISAGTFADGESARAEGMRLAALLSAGAEWPFVGNRFVRPDAVVSIDLDVSL